MCFCLYFKPMFYVPINSNKTTTTSARDSFTFFCNLLLWSKLPMLIFSSILTTISLGNLFSFSFQSPVPWYQEFTYHCLDWWHGHTIANSYFLKCPPAWQHHPPFLWQHHMRLYLPVSRLVYLEISIFKDWYI